MEELDKIRNSKLSFQILRLLIEDERTPTEMGKELDTSSNSVNNYLRPLLELNVVQRGARSGMRQPYELKENGLVNLWGRFWGQKAESVKTLQRSLEESREIDDEEFEENISRLLKTHLRSYSIDDEVTLEKVFVNDLLEGFSEVISRPEIYGFEENQIPYWLERFSNEMVLIELFDSDNRDSEKNAVDVIRKTLDIKRSDMGKVENKLNLWEKLLQSESK